MRTIEAKTIITRRQHPKYWFGCDYNMNIYKGCCHGCIYCDSRSECYGVEGFDEVRAKKDALSIIDKELAGKRKKGVVGTGAMSDPYNPFEEEECLTQRALELLLKYRFGVFICTKSSLVMRDKALLKEISKHAPVCIGITVTTFDDALGKIIEPNVPSSSERFEAIRELAQEGIYTGILLMPLLPFINDTQNNISRIVEQAAKSGAGFIYPAFGVTLRQNQRDYFYKQLNSNFPGMKEKYIRTYGNEYACNSQNSASLFKLFSNLCAKNGLRYAMPDIISGFKANKNLQLKLF